MSGTDSFATRETPGDDVVYLAAFQQLVLERVHDLVTVMDPLGTLAVGVGVGVGVKPGVGGAQGASGIGMKKTLLSTSPLPPTSETEAVTSSVPV